MSIFEIHSEGGKGEKILDLSGNGLGLTFQNSTMIGLKEVNCQYLSPNCFKSLPTLYGLQLPSFLLTGDGFKY